MFCEIIAFLKFLWYKYVKVNYILPALENQKKKYYENHQNGLAILKNEVVKNGFYIPIVDFYGKIIFTYEEYQELKQKMEGLSHY